MRGILTTVAFTLSATLACQSAFAKTDYENLVIFGDSLSDTGNLQVFSQDPNMPSRFTNGPVAIEVLAAQLGLTVSNSLHLTGAQYGNNFAVAGAIALDDDGDETTFDINLPTQINSYLAFNGYQADAQTLYVLMMGGNDIRAARTIAASNAKDARKHAKARIVQATQSINTQLQKLIASGAQHIMVVNAPDIGAIPETDIVAMQLAVVAENKKALRKADKIVNTTSVLSAQFNHRLFNISTQLAEQYPIDIINVDLFQFMNDTIENAESYGLNNTDDACIYVFSAGGAFNPECNLDTFLFFDEIHPTTNVHQRAGMVLFESLMAQ